ncbi:MAG: signal peptide peptidase SppA [Planctomycetes bacterium]|nr:signal peptide peptidase SppA [Planctomycetota bacterium]
MSFLAALVPLVLLCHLPPQQPAPPTAADTAAAQPAQAPQRVPLLKPAGSYADLAEMAFDPTSLLVGADSPPKPFFKLIDAIDRLAAEPESEVMLDLAEGLGLNLAQLREVERAMARLRGAGKRVTCYLENAGPVTFQVAALCDHVMMADMGSIDLRSPALSVMHMKDALDLLGIEVEVTRVGAFKGAVEPFMLPAMSTHLRSHYEAMLRSMNTDIVRRIAQARRIPEDRVRQLQAHRLFSAAAAKAEGLIDRIVPWCGRERALAIARGDEAFELVDVGPKKKAPRRDLMAILASLLRKSDDEEIEAPQLVVMHLSGQIVDGQKPNPGSMVSGVAVKKLDELTANDLVKGVVVRINSPGGSATASEAIRQALQRLAAKKPVVFSMGELAASGGYWITTIGRPIFAEVGTITGSIGVFGMRFQPGTLMRRIGLHNDIVSLDDGALMDAIDRPWSDAARQRMQGFVDDVYDRFLGLVAASRGREVAAIDAIAGGRVWSGQQAVENGLVDAIGGLDAAIAMVRQQAGLGDDVEVMHVPEPKSFADSLFTSMFEAGVAAAVDGGIDGELLRAAVAHWCRFPEVAGVLRDGLASDGSMRIYVLMPPGLRVH